MYDEEDIEFVRNLDKTLSEDFNQMVTELGVPDIPKYRIKWYEGLLIASREDPVDDYVLQKLCETMIENKILQEKLKAAHSSVPISLN